jgi:hypothetical protein
MKLEGAPEAPMLSLLALIACNTCPTPKLYDPHVADGLQEDADGTFLALEWWADDRLPDAWWTSVEVSAVPNSLEAVEVTGPGALEVRVADRADLEADGAVFLLAWGDPRQEMTCDHPGMDDGFRTALVLEVFENRVSAWFTGLEVDRGVL